ncbi:MAG: transposase [Rubricoccaceae bacterium]
MGDRRAVTRPERRSPRLRGYDYRQPGLYFVTIVTADRQLVFGEIHDHAMALSEIGELARACWEAIPEHHVGVELDAFVVMPNHVHGLIALTGASPHDAPPDSTRRDGIYPVPDTMYGVPTPTSDGHKGVSLSTVVGTYKAAVTRARNRQFTTPGAPLWQPRFHDRIVRLRNPDELANIRRYIGENPARWHKDREHPAR